MLGGLQSLQKHGGGERVRGTRSLALRNQTTLCHLSAQTIPPRRGKAIDSGGSRPGASLATSITRPLFFSRTAATFFNATWYPRAPRQYRTSRTRRQRHRTTQWYHRVLRQYRTAHSAYTALLPPRATARSAGGRSYQPAEEGDLCEPAGGGFAEDIVVVEAQDRP